MGLRCYTLVSLFLWMHQQHPGCWAAGSSSRSSSRSSSNSIVDDLFPPHEDYDANILDPFHGYGSPYGGFSRATRRRLAALPLMLPDLTVEDNNSDESSSWDDPLYTTVRDGTTGQWYACRVFHEDEVMPQSIVDSMYAPPILRHESSIPTETVEIRDEVAMDKAENDIDAAEQETEDGAVVDPLEDVMKIVEITTRLEALKGLCGQIHKGWWSYEWCHQSTMAQFHVAIREKDAGRVELQDITNLGDFQRREMELHLQDSPPNPLAKDRKEAARVTDIHEGGTICPDTGKPRESLVHLICCADDIMSRKKNLIRKGDSAFTNNDFAVYDIVEDPHQVCHYNVTICTPLLCEKEEEAIPASSSSSPTESQKEETRTVHKENESVMEILDRTLGGDKPFCLQSITGGWWNFEFCHGKSIRQYHEVVGTKRDKNGVPQTTRVVETDHNLGQPQVSVFRAIVPEDEWRFVVNATDNKGGKKPYFELEYTNGDICDDHDVRDAAIVAGNTGAKGLARASSVRYSCGEKYDISVNEDSSCHYVVNIMVPDLCRHTLFKTPVSKKQVFKCLPIDDPDVDADSILG
uniref:MRH domain-containing protein n=1 Tax=Amphora coffeiformis TaxID=265554 RepID=A0A7S3L2Q1_9STRA